jgi:hypothetical protein
VTPKWLTVLLVVFVVVALLRTRSTRSPVSQIVLATGLVLAYEAARQHVF